MNGVMLPFETWQAIISILRANALPSMIEHADHSERLLEQHGLDRPRSR